MNKSNIRVLNFEKVFLGSILSDIFPPQPLDECGQATLIASLRVGSIEVAHP